MKTVKLSCSLLLLILCVMAHGDSEQTASRVETTRLTENGLFQVGFTSKLEPVVINTIHAWIIHVKDVTGEPVPDAEISVDGGMPAHDHGLPTRPQMTRNLGKGNYLVEGMKFHMGGLWTVTVTVTDGNASDQITFDLNL